MTANHLPSTTRRAGVLLLLVSLASALFLAAPGLAQSSGPKAVVPKTGHDFGPVTVGIDQKTEFLVENQGDAPLVIREIKTNCACTITQHDSTIEPGQKGKVAVTLDTSLLVGPTTRAVTVLTNDAANPSIELSLTVDVRLVIGMNPAYVRYVVTQGFEGHGAIHQLLWSTDNDEMVVTAVDSPYPFVTTAFREASEEQRNPDFEGRQWIVQTQMSPEAPIGPLAGFLEIHIDHPKQPIARVPISGFVRPVFAVTPNGADFGRVEVGKAGIKASLHVKNFATELIEITRVENDVPGLNTELEPIEDGRTYWLYLHVTPDIGKGPFGGTLKLHTSSARKPVIEVEVRGLAI